MVHHSLSPRNSGFIPLGNSRSRDQNGGEDIQLTPVKSNVSVKSTGVRKATGLSNSFESSEQGDNEKDGPTKHRGRRRKITEATLERSNTGDEASSLNAMGRLYNKIVGFSIVTRYLVYVAPIALLLAVPLIVLPITGNKNKIPVGGNTNSHGQHVGPPLFKLFLWIEIMWLSCWLAKLVAFFLPSAFMFFCGVVSPGTRKYAQVLRNLVIPFSFFFWALASWITFQNLYKPTSQYVWTDNVQRVLGSLFVSSAVFLAEKAIVQLIGITYHQRSFALRIKASKREIYLLGLLYDASRTIFPMYCPEFAAEDHVINDSIELMLRSKGKKGHKRAGSATPMRLLNDVGRIGDKVTSVFGNIASEITGKEVFNPNSAHSVVVEALEKKASSEALARRIWMSFVVEGRNALFLDDFQEVLGPAYKDEAEEAFYAVDNDENGDISLDEMVRKTVDMGTERKAISEGMKDIGQALRVFDSVLLFVVLLIVIFIFLTFFKSSFITTLTTAGTALLSLSFAFSVTTQEFLGSCIFLFVKHPYDVGDRVEINSIQMVVDKISLLYTVFTRADRQQVTQTPNIVLNNLPIDNISRSKAMTEVITVNVSFDTSFEDIELLRLEMERFVRDGDNSRDFQPNLSIAVGGVNDLDKLTLTVGIQHKSNWHNDAVRASRRSKFMCALTLALRKVPIYPPGGGYEAPGTVGNPAYSVAVSDDDAAKKRDNAAKAKEAARLVPSKPTEENEKAAATEISSRPPAGDVHWDARDDNTLGSDDASRSRDIETIRNDLHRESTLGRRKPGEALPPLNLETAPRISVSSQPRSPQPGPFDEEAETGMGTTPYHSNLSAGTSGGQYQPYGGYQSNVQNPLQPSLSQRRGPSSSSLSPTQSGQSQSMPKPPGPATQR